MRDAARQLADRLHLLRLDELRLQRLLLRQVEEMQDQIVGPLHPSREQLHDDGPARAEQGDLHRRGGGAGGGLADPVEGGQHGLAVIFGQDVLERLALDFRHR